jgi:hypothetical protein
MALSMLEGKFRIVAFCLCQTKILVKLIGSFGSFCLLFAGVHIVNVDNQECALRLKVIVRK